MQPFSEFPAERTYLSLSEEVGQVLHCVGAEAGDVLVLAGMLRPQSGDTVRHVVRHLDADLHAQHQHLREHCGQPN